MNDLARLTEAGEQVLVQAIVPEAPVKTIDVGGFGRLVWIYKYPPRRDHRAKRYTHALTVLVTFGKILQM